MKKFIVFCFVVLLSSLATGQPIQFPGQQVLKTSFQENLWVDLWGDNFVPGIDFLVVSNPLSSTINTVHRAEWNEAARIMDGEVGAGFLTSVDTYDMDWAESGTESESVPMPDGTVWNGTVSLSTSAFSGTLSSGNGYEPHVYGMAQTLTVVDLSIGGDGFTIEVLMPTGRAVTLDAARNAAESFAEEISPPLLPVLEEDDCVELFYIWDNNAKSDWNRDKEGCGMLAGAAGGFLGGAGVGGLLGSVVPGFGTAAGALILGTTGAIGGAIFGKSRCLRKAKDKYWERHFRYLACKETCFITGEWGCFE